MTVPARLGEAVKKAARIIERRSDKQVNRECPVFQELIDSITDALRDPWREEVEAAEEAQDAECIKDVVHLIRNCVKHALSDDAGMHLLTLADSIENSPRDKDSKGALARHDTALVERTRQEAASVIDAWVRSHEFAGEGPCTEDCFEYSCSDLKRIATEIRALAEKAGGSL